MGLWERQIKTKDPPQPQEWKKWKKEEKKRGKVWEDEKNVMQNGTYIYKPDPQRRPQQQQMSKCQL